MASPNSSERFSFDSWATSNRDAFLVFQGAMPSSWRAVATSLEGVLQLLYEAISQDLIDDANQLKRILLRTVAHCDCLASARVEGDITPDAWCDSLSIYAQKLLPAFPDHLHKSAKTWLSTQQKPEKETAKAVLQSSLVPYLTPKADKAVGEVLAMSKRYMSITAPMLRLTALLIQSQLVEHYLKRSMVTTNTMREPLPKSMQASQRKLRSLPPNKDFPEAELLDLVRRSCVAQSPQTHEVWLSKVLSKKAMFSVVKRSNTFPNPRAAVKNETLYMKFVPHSVDENGKKYPVTFGSLKNSKLLIDCGHERRKQDDLSEDLVECATNLLAHPSFAKKPISMIIEVQLYLHKFLELKKIHSAVALIARTPTAVELTRDCEKHATSRKMSARVYQLGSGDIELLDKIGKGNQGEVWTAKMGEITVAVKTLSAAYRELRDHVGTFGILNVKEEMDREAAALSAMRHPNIVKFLGTGFLPDKTRFIAMEFMAKGSLRSLLDDETQELPWTGRLQICYDGAAGMAFLHEQDRVHRDLKSANLLISQNNTCKVADFGQMTAACAVGTDVAGTPLWLGPELLRVASGAVPPGQAKASDVYAWGIIMWEVCTRKWPWSHLQGHQGVSTVYEAVRRGDRPPVDSDLDAEESTKRYTDLMKRCWAQEPEDRPNFENIMQQLFKAERSRLSVKPRPARPIKDL